MANPADAYPGTYCENCEEEIGAGNPIYFADGEKLCEACADSAGNVCECGNYKSSEFKECYECSRA